MKNFILRFLVVMTFLGGAKAFADAPARAVMIALDAPATVSDAGPGPATAPALANPEVDVGGYFGDVYNSLTGHKFKELAILILVGVVFLARKFGGMVWDGFKTDRGGAILALSTSVLQALAAALFSGQAVTFGLLSGAILVGLTAAGGWSVVRKILGISSETPPPTTV